MTVGFVVQPVLCIPYVLSWCLQFVEDSRWRGESLHSGQRSSRAERRTFVDPTGSASPRSRSRRCGIVVCGGGGWGEGQTVKATRPLSLPLRQLIRIQFHNVVAGILGSRVCWSELEAWKCRWHSRYSQCPREVLSWSGERLTWITTECSTKNRKIRCQSS